MAVPTATLGPRSPAADGKLAHHSRDTPVTSVGLPRQSKLTVFGDLDIGRKRPSGKWLLPVPVANPLATKKTPAAGR